MQIGFLIYGDINTVSGGYLYDRKLIQYFHSQGDHVKVISLKEKNYFQNVLVNEPISTFNDLKLDVLIQDELVHPSIFRTNQLINKKLPIITLVHLFRSFSAQPGYKNWLYKVIEGHYLSTVDGIIFNSSSSYEQGVQIMGERMPDNIIARPAGNNFNEINFDNINNKTDSTPGQLKILYVGNIIKQKGLHILLEALKRLKNNDYKLTVIGREDLEPEYVKNIYKLIRKYQLDSQVQIHGPLPLERLPDHYKSHDVLALPSTNEAFGIVFLEAMQFGLPVIGTTSGGAKEIIKDKHNGFLISPGDSSKLAEYFKQLRKSQDTLKTMSNNAINDYLKHPRWQDTGRNIRMFIEKFVR